MVNESVDELPLPPHPNGGTNISQQQQPHSTNVPSSSAGGSNTTSRYSILPTQTQTSSNSSKRSQSQPSKDSQSNKAPELPKVPPKIDRQKKPSRRSATERLFGNGEVSGNYMNSESNPTSGHNGSNGTATVPHSQSVSTTNRASHHPHSSSSLDRHTHIRDMKMVGVYVILA